MKIIEFWAVPSGDYECFTFAVDRQTFIDINGNPPEEFDRNTFHPKLFNLYPTTVFEKKGVAKQKFTVVLHGDVATVDFNTSEYHPMILQIAKAMAFKFQKNIKKKGTWNSFDENGNRIWTRADIEFLLKKIDEEVAELKAEVNAFDISPEKVLHEAADVANTVGMLADIFQKHGD